MPSPYKEIPITFEKGLVTEIEESLLDIGQASELLNYEPSANGALRVRNAYQDITKTGLTAPYSVRGFGAIATGTAVAGAVTGPVIVQSNHWPSGDADPAVTRTATLNGVNIGNVLVAVVTDNSNLTPSVTAGWTERAISTGNRQHVRFYTKTAAASTEAFTYTIAQARIRSLSVYEVKYLDSEDPGTKWAANSVTSGSGGTDSVTVNATDADGGLALVGYLYDGGTPNSSASGTAGYASPSLDNSNTRVGVTFEDLDQLDGSNDNGDLQDNSQSYTSPSWTPPSSGVVIILIALPMIHAAGTVSSMSVTGNGLTWHDALDASELGVSGDALNGGCLFVYAWADCSAVVGTTGAITVSVTLSVGNGIGIACSFVRAIGADTVAPFVQRATGIDSTNPMTATLAAALTDGSGLLGIASGDDSAGAISAPVPVLTAGHWEAALDSFDINNSLAAQQSYIRTAFNDSNAPDTTQDWTITGGVVSYTFVTYEIKGQGNAARHYRDGLTGIGTAIEGFTYVANKEMTAKMVVWGYTPPAVQPDVVDFYIVMAVAVNATTYKVYRIPRDQIETGTWEQIDVITDATDTNAFVSFAQGAGHLIWTASTMGFPRAIELATLSQFNITQLAGLAGRTAAYHKDRMFIAGSKQNPSRVYFSDIGLPLSYTTATDFLDIGGDDGEAIQDLSSVEGLLLIPKTNRAYLVSGSGVESFFVNELAGGTAASGRSAIRTPYGTLLAGVDDIWVVQGGGVDPMSRPLGSGYVIAGTVSTAYAQDSALVVDSGNSTPGNIWRVNLVTGAWALEEVAGLSADSDVHLVFSLNGRIYYGTNNSATQVGGTRKLSSPRTFDETSGGMRQIAATGKIALLGPSVKYTARYLFFQLRNHDATKPNVLYVDVESDQGIQTEGIMVSKEITREVITLGEQARGAEWLKIRVRSASSAIAGAIDPERIVLGVETEAPRTR